MKQKEITRQYRKQLNRINKYINKWESQGKVISFKEKSLIKPTLKSVERLKKLTAKELSKRARYVDIETGDLISESLWKEKRNQMLAIRRKRNGKIVYVPVYDIYERIKELILLIPDYKTVINRNGSVIQISTGEFTKMLIGFLDDIYSVKGEDADNYLLSIENNLALSINKVIEAHYYEDYSAVTIEVANYLKGTPLTQRESNIISENNDGLGVWF